MFFGFHWKFLSVMSPKSGHLMHAHMWRVLLVVHTQQKFCCQNFAVFLLILSVGRPVCVPLFSSDGWLLQNIKTLVHEEFNILQTDVFIFCNKRWSEENKRTQTGRPLNSILCRNCTRLYVKIVLGCT